MRSLVAVVALLAPLSAAGSLSDAARAVGVRCS
jgi:molybdenum-dependent DNA-binding transcriptional regulator ModE